MEWDGFFVHIKKQKIKGIGIDDMIGPKIGGGGIIFQNKIFHFKNEIFHFIFILIILIN